MVLNDPSAAEPIQAIFGMGTWETMIILVVALIFLGPDKLPAVAKSIGKGMRTLRRAMSSVEYEVQAMTNPDRYAPPPRKSAQANAEAARAAQANAVAADGAHPHGLFDEFGHPLPPPDEAAPDEDHLTPPPDYDHHQAPSATSDPATTNDNVDDDGAPVAAAHPYRPAPRQPAATKLEGDPSAAAEAHTEEDAETA